MRGAAFAPVDERGLEGMAWADLVLPAKNVLDPALEPVAVDTGQESEGAKIHSEDRRGESLEFAGSAKDGSIAAEHDHHVGNLADSGQGPAQFRFAEENRRFPFQEDRDVVVVEDFQQFRQAATRAGFARVRDDPHRFGSAWFHDLRRTMRNSLLPAGPSSGDSVTPRTVNPRV